MSEYIFDEEIHSLSKDWAYISKKIKDFNLNSEESNLRKIQFDFLKKYIEYLYCFDKEKVIKILIDHFMGSFALGYCSDPDITFIYKPPHFMDSFAEKATFSFKFKRAPNDNLKHE